MLFLRLSAAFCDFFEKIFFILFSFAAVRDGSAREIAEYVTPI